MDIHKPKPVHGWRDFIKEIGSIVLGVSIALAGEQLVESIHWRNQVAEARVVLTDEITDNITGGIENMRASACTERRLDLLAGILATARQTGRLPPLGDIYQPPTPGWSHGAWDSFVASQAAAHLGHDELADMGNYYTYIIRTGDVAEKMIDDWSGLLVMVGPGRPIDGHEVADLEARVTRARTMTRYASLMVMRLLDAAKDHLVFSPTNAAGINTAFHQQLDLPICAPLGPVPPAYGNSMGAASMQMMDAMVKNPPRLKVGN